MKIASTFFLMLTFTMMVFASETEVKNGSKYDAVVSTNDSGAYPTIQAAIAAAPSNSAKAFNILVKSGTYEGPFMVPKEKQHLRLVGEDMKNTVLDWPFNVGEKQSGATYSFNPGLVVVGDDFSAKNLTIQNTSGDHGQALALRVDGDRAVFNHCRITGWQDTLMINSGRDYFTNCFIAGRVDFIYGSATAVFDRCEIQSRNGGHVTAASTPEEKPFGFVFLDCKLTGDPTPWVNPTNTTISTNSTKKALADLGRPWRPYASVVYVSCEMGEHIKPEGWNNWRNPTNELTARFAEYRSTGPGANPEQRAKWVKQLTDAEAGTLTVEKILGGSDDWKPQFQPGE